MCSLVAYGSSDESEEEDNLDKNLHVSEFEESKNVNQNEDEAYPAVRENKENSVSTDQTEAPDSDRVPSELPDTPFLENKTSPHKTLFSSLPQPKKGEITLVPDSDFSTSSNKTMQKKQTVKISIPSLSEFTEQEEEEPKKKRLKPSMKGSGLFSLLPAPKNASTKEIKRPLVPHVLTKKSDGPSTPKSAHASANGLKKQINPAIVPVIGAGDKTSSGLISYADSEEESDGEGDFFSLNKDIEVVTDGVNAEPHPETQNFETNCSSSLTEGSESSSPPVDEPLTFNAKFNPSPWSNNAAGAPTAVQNSWQKRVDQGENVTTDSNYISVQQEDLELNEEALQRLCGRRAKRQHQEMQLVEVSGDAIMPDPKEWLTKQLTQEQDRRSHSHRKNDGPTTQQRRKHQITYLAFQAKENELELKNQWSQNRMSRKQTQSKYGF